ncbi:MAG: AAA family ATPase [Patescibacteria group bacterium]
MPKLVIIRGYSGTGKTTVSKKLAKKYRWELINYDAFFFGINQYEKKLKNDYKICFETIKDCIKLCIKNKRDIILEGALAPINKYDVYNTKEIVKLAKKSKYSVIRILLVGDEQVNYQRMRKRKNIVKKWVYWALRKKIDSEKPNSEIVINTNTLTAKQVENRIEKLIKPEKD